MGFLLKLSGRIDRLSEQIGRVIMWLILIAVLLGAGNANGDIIIEAEDERAIGDLDEPRPAGGNVRRLLMYDLQL